MTQYPPFARPVAHRGLHDRQRGIIENSPSAFTAAIERRFGIECDLQLTADGEAVVFHDDDISRLVGGNKLVRALSANELTALPLLESATSDCPQTFAAFLDQIDGRTPLVIEIKKQANAKDTSELAKRVVQTLATYQGPFVLKTFDPRMIVAVRRQGFSGEIGIITYGYDKPEWYGDMPAQTRFVLRHLLHYPWTRFTFISCEQTALGLPAIRLFRALGFKVMSWTVRTADQAKIARHNADQIVFEGFDPDA
ncbi:glycerophosphodiester phosphodiesterase family protein [Pelagibacterium sp.]|uniref:glycerophosphodiester phosphodiesterase family protein n=1 Tax=Pelagibacterium sp. TaxID=1967288 RepID=UPI003A941B38